MNVLRIPVPVTIMQTASIMTVLTAVLVNKVLMATGKLVKVPTQNKGHHANDTFSWSSFSEDMFKISFCAVCKLTFRHLFTTPTLLFI